MPTSHTFQPRDSMTDPCLDAAYAEWGTQKLTAAQRKRYHHRTSTIGEGTPSKTLKKPRLQPQPQPGGEDNDDYDSDSDFWKEVEKVAGAAKKQHQSVVIC